MLYFSMFIFKAGHHIDYSAFRLKGNTWESTISNLQVEWLKSVVEWWHILENDSDAISFCVPGLEFIT